MSNSQKPNFDLAYARGVISSEAEAVKALAAIIDRTFLNALEMLYNCTGSVVVTENDYTFSSKVLSPCIFPKARTKRACCGWEA